MLLVAVCCAASLFAADVPPLRTNTAVEQLPPWKHSPGKYYWKSNSVGNSAQLLALFCRACATSGSKPEDVPLVAVLRDTLGDNDPHNDRVTDVWLLTYSRPSIGQRVLAAVPFFYWRVGGGSDKPSSDPKPLLNLNAPQHPMWREVERDLLQWTLFDPMTTGVRATSRAYRTNQRNYERLHLEEAIGYLRQAPVSAAPDALTGDQVNTVVARLALRKRLLGGLVAEGRAAKIGKRDGFQSQAVRIRNWELLRECAGRTGLVFQPLSLAGGPQQYAILWFPLGSSFHPSSSLSAVWKLLAIKNPWKDERLKNWHGPVFSRVLDSHGALVSPAVNLVPLAVYSLNYPRNPLLLVDFRGERHLRRHEVLQRTINEVTAGVIGISHFTNWYYYVAADLYRFVATRHGHPLDAAERLDCYAQFRVQLALDQRLDPELRADIQRGFEKLAMNPLSSAPQRQFTAAKKRYARLVFGSDDQGPVEARLKRQRRAEIASFGESTAGRMRDSLLHAVTFGVYTRAARRDSANLAMLDIERRVSHQLNFLHALLKSGTPPEVACDPSRIQHAIAELNDLMPFVRSRRVQQHARATLAQLDEQTASAAIKSHATLVLASLGGEEQPSHTSVPGIAAAIR
ncbi:MAG TPA: hypothetical protein VF283_09985 [Bryobacteraceae bacterium]